MAELYNFIDYEGNVIEEALHATEESHGLMCPEDKVKLSAIDPEALPKIYIQETEPEDAEVGSIWIDTTGDYEENEVLYSPIDHSHTLSELVDDIGYVTGEELGTAVDTAEANATKVANIVVSDHNADTTAHNDIRLAIQNLSDEVDTLKDGIDEETLKQLKEVVAYMESNVDLIESVTTGKVSVSDIVDNLTTNDATKPLSAAQGVVLKSLIDSITHPTKVSEFVNDASYVNHTELMTAVTKALTDAKNSGTFDGKSAYEYAQEGGYTGTEAEFIEKLASKDLDFANVEFDNETRYLKFLDEDGNNVYDPVYIEGGGGGGTSSTTVVKLTNNTGVSSFTIPKGSSLNISFTFTSLDDGISTGDGTCKVTSNGVDYSPFSIKQGETVLEVSKYLTSGTNTFKITCSDVYGNYKILNYTISVIDLSITSTFDDTVIYTGDIQLKYIVYGAIEKTVHILVDGEEKYTDTTSTTNKQTTATIAALPHGTHRFNAYVDATLDGTYIESDHLIYDVMCIGTATDILIASVFETETASQGTMLSIPYTVYNPSSLTTDISLTISTEDGIYSEQNLTVDRLRQYWNVRNYPEGEVTFTIQAGEYSKSHTVTVTPLDIGVEAVTNDLELYLSSSGRSNNEKEPGVWEYNNIATTFDSVNWDSTGWVSDDIGDTVLRLNGGATAEINFKPFENDWKTYGKTIEIEFAVRDVNNRDAVVMSCMDEGIGFEVKADTARLKSEQEEISCNYCDEDRIRVSFVVESKSEYRLMQIYLNGVLSGAKQYTTSDNFQQNNPVNITIGSEYCGIDLYTIRSYTTALTFNEVINNYIYDISNINTKVETAENNDLYNDYGQIQYEKVKKKIPVMTIIGDLPQSKGDKKDTKVIFEHNTNSDLNFTDTGTIDVQGTSSQWYIRKNYKLKLSTKHQHDVNQIPTKVFCVKADYAEATSTHNTQNANLVETLYSEKTPAQKKDARCRTTVYGYPIVIFHKATEESTPEFIGKYNFNFDKGSEDVYGFDGSFDVESWEFLNNTSNLCNFLAPFDDTWADSFEARYPEDYTNITRFKEMHDWVVSTIGNVNKFRDEFEDHFNLHYTLIYYVYTSVMLMVDQRAKNMFLTYWADTGKFEPWLYDNDTALGINNEGNLVFDYYHEDIDTLDGANVYNGQNSTLWYNFREAFQDEIKECYQDLRNNGKLTYEKIIEYFITNGSDRWSESIYNEDSDYKYISMLRSDGDATNLYQIRGDGESHLEYFVSNRLKYFDSKWQASDYMNNYVVLRIYTPSEYAGIKPNANITVTPFSNMYTGVKYKANGTLQQIRATKNEPTLFEAPNETFNDTETAIFGASELSSLGDLAPLYCGSINVSAATRLVILKIGDSTLGYSNTNLTDLSIGTNRLLKVINVCNCPNLVKPLALTGCPNIEEIYATGSGITSVELPESGYVKILQLPDTITNLTLTNQLYITDFYIEGYSNLTTLNIENCPSIDVFSIMNQSTNLKRLRLAKVDWTFSDASTVLKLARAGYAGIDESGNNVNTANISGNCYIETLEGSELAEIQKAFPYLKISYTNLTSYLIFMNGDGTTEIYRETIINAADGTDPVKEGKISAPTKESTDQYAFTYANGWSTSKDSNTIDPNALKHVEGDRYVYPVFNLTIRKYVGYFYNGDNLLEVITNIPYGGSFEYSGDATALVKTNIDNPEDFRFLKWKPEPTNITGETKCYAQYKYTGIMTYKLLDKLLPGGIDNDRVTTIGDYAMYNMTEITSIEFPNVISTGEYSFAGCTALERATLPLVETIGNYSFYECAKLPSAEFDNVISIGNYAFGYCTALTDITIESVKSVGSQAFYNTSISSINLPNVITINTETFYNCYNLNLVTLPNVTTIGTYAFYYCYNLEAIDLPSVETLERGAFYICTKLSSVKLPIATTIGQGAFYSCNISSIELPKATSIGVSAFADNPLESLTLRSETLCTLNNINALENTPIAKGTGYVYVPAVLYNTYRNATNWTVYADQIVPYDSCVEYIDDKVYVFNGTDSISVELVGYDEVPTVTVQSNNTDVSTISNINATADLLTFDINTLDMEGASTITITATNADNDTFTRKFKVYVVEELSTYTVEDVSGATYGFTLNDNGYYESENKGQSASYALCKININNPAGCNVYIDCISSGETNYDYGILSTVDGELTLSNTADTENVFKSFRGLNSESVQTVDYGVISGAVYAKFIKDNSGNSKNDSLQFRVRFDYSGGK